MSIKWKGILAIMLLIALVLTACGGNEGEETAEVVANETEQVEESDGEEKDLPTLNVGYIYNDHSLPIMVAAHKAEEFKERGAYLETVIDKERYRLISAEGEPVANLEMIVTNSGSEAATLFAQNQLDISFFSITVVMSNRDRDVPIKALGPIHTEGNSMVFRKDMGIGSWDEFEQYVKEADEPVTLGYLSPTSSVTIITKSALEKNGIHYTEDPDDRDADVLLVNLRATSNYMPALTSGQVDGWVGPSPFPMVAEYEEVGIKTADTKDYAPIGHWVDFPCCCLVASESAIEAYPEAMAVFVELMEHTAEFSNENRDEAAIVVAEWIGIPEEAAKMSTVRYTTVPTEGWMRGTEILYHFLDDSDHFEGGLAGMEFEEVEGEIFDFRYTQ
ncbi:ABC transporter substrate-binding protein [Tindallia californiensis]|uniref:NitT/TauT family transport system substrate-binding protein n=1 Tax=Tindallia californiensis TaxID=159292 RepID=A0A1H3Q2G7_9FIRM|nr:ABC transporter substrate-binding protein [Tindallia californiensis]SDZ07361.1 NitT/TauT family transport system substrate-binding protein [Tindallia californiensis]